MLWVRLEKIATDYLPKLLSTLNLTAARCCLTLHRKPALENQPDTKGDIKVGRRRRANPRAGA